MHNNGYWRNGPIGNNAVSGIDMALWDIKGKEANMPVYDLLGGKCREAVALYGYANGTSRKEILDEAQTRLEEGFHHIRLQYFPMRGYPENQKSWRPEGAKASFYQDPKAYVGEVIGMFATRGIDLVMCRNLYMMCMSGYPHVMPSILRKPWSPIGFSSWRICLRPINTNIIEM